MGRGRGPGVKRRLQDATLCELMARGYDVPSAAKEVGVSARTVYRRLQDAEFQQKLEERQSALFEVAGRAVIMLGASAVATLNNLMNDATTPASVRANCARSILDLGRSFRDSFDLAKRINALEQTAAEQAEP